jgi:hypothetical protein
MLKNFNKLAIQEQNQKHPKAILFGLCMFNQCKKQDQKICKLKQKYKKQLIALKTIRGSPSN